MDKFYTKSEIANLCFNTVLSHLILNADIIEPSCGTGEFVKYIENFNTDYSKIYYDIDPKINFEIKGKLIHDDFLNNKVYKSHIIGNPPFGNNSDMINKFINNCKNALSISFILPKSFLKKKMQQVFLNAGFLNIKTIILPENSFYLENGTIKNVPCIFQIWIKTEIKLIEKKNIKPILYSFISKNNRNQANISFRRVGGNAGEIKNYIVDDAIDSYTFIKFEFDYIKFLEIYDKNIFNKCKVKTTGPNSISQKNIIKNFNKIISNLLTEKECKDYKSIKKQNNEISIKNDKILNIFNYCKYENRILDLFYIQDNIYISISSFIKNYSDKYLITEIIEINNNKYKMVNYNIFENLNIFIDIQYEKENLNDEDLQEEFYKSKFVLKFKEDRYNFYKKWNVEENIINNMIIDELKLFPYLINAGCKGVIRGNIFEKIIQNKLLELKNKYNFELFFQYKLDNGFLEKLDFLIKYNNKEIWGMIQIDLWTGGAQLNRGFKYIEYKTPINILLLSVIEKHPFIKNEEIKKNSRKYKLLYLGFINNKICYKNGIENIIKYFFDI